MTARPWRRLAAAAAAAVVALAAGGCGTSVYIGNDGPDPANRSMRCDRPADSPSGLLVLIAQAVPTGSSVPCLEGPITNWMMSKLEVRDGSALIEFAYEYGADDRATIEVRRDCDVGTAREVSSRHNGMQRFNKDVTRGGRYANEIYYRYPGACTALRFDLAAEGAELRGAEVAGELGFVTREFLDQQIRKASDNHLELDPEPDGD